MLHELLLSSPHILCFLLLGCVYQILKELDEKEKNSLHRLEGCTWHPEYGSWMVEATPRRPFSGYAADLVRVRYPSGLSVFVWGCSAEQLSTGPRGVRSMMGIPRLGVVFPPACVCQP